MSRFSHIFDSKTFNLRECADDDLGILSSQLEDMNLTISSCLGAIGTAMFWASAGSPDGDDRLSESDALGAVSQVGELLQILSVLSLYIQRRDCECGWELAVRRENKTPKTAIDGASNIQSRH